MTARPSPPFRDFEVSAMLREVAEPGSGKSMFRRPLKPQPYVARHCTVCGLGMGEWSACDAPDCGDLGPGVPIVKTLPFAIGDLLWCREAWAKVGDEPDDIHACPDMRIHAYYRADAVDPERQHWRSSTQMPRWSSRLTLEVVDVKIERLQEISEEDARSEGAYPCEGGFTFGGSPLAGTTAYGAFYCAWLRTHDLASWSANPFVAAVTFRPHLANVDDLLRQREGGR